jgi:hypothetical protein
MTTAVEFLYAALSLHFTQEQEMQFVGLFQQALELEKEQIQDAFADGFVEGVETQKSGEQLLYPEQYYNNIYKIN